MRRLVGICVVAVAALGVAAGSAFGTFKGRNGLLVYTGYSSRGSTVFVINPNGTGRRAIFSQAVHARWSRNGKFLVFYGYPGNRAGIYYGQPGHPAKRIPLPAAIVRRGLDFPTWAPDGKHVAFVVGPSSQAPRIYRVALDGRGLRLLHIGSHPDYSNNGRLIVFDRFRRGHAAGPALMTPNGRIVKALSSSPRDDLPSFAPDSRHVLFLRWVEGAGHVSTAHLMVIDTVTRKARMLPVSGTLNATWAPDGRTILYDQSDAPSQQVWSITPNGRNAHLLFTLPPSEAGNTFSWQPRP